MSTLTDRELRLRAKLKEDFEVYGKACLRIRTKSGAIQPLLLNRSQRYVHERLEDQRRRTGKVRALILKGRQIGVSTYIAGRFYWRTSHGRGLRAFIMAHLDTASDNLFGIAKNYHDNCPALVKPQTGASNAKELNFSVLGSGYKVATAGSKEVGRSETIQLLHASEFAFWPNQAMHAAGLGQAIADVEGTEDIRESTANGPGDAFHNMWRAAVKGESEYEAIFVPWYWHEEYVKTVPEGFSFPEKWVEYGRQCDLTVEQLYWAFNKSRDLCLASGGDVDDIHPKFRQEYPATADEAFQSSGERAFIKPLTVMAARQAKKEDILPYGPLILGVDPARGGGDKTGLVDRQGRVMGRNCCKTIDHDDLMAVAGEVVQEVKKLLPLGLSAVVIDITGLGSGLYDRLRERLGGLVVPINFSNSAIEHNRFRNRRSEIWDNMREWFDDPAGVWVADSDELQTDICLPVWGKGATHFDSAGRLCLEGKDHIKERLNDPNASPDYGDAAALTFGVDVGAWVGGDDEDDDVSGEDRSGVTGY